MIQAIQKYIPFFLFLGVIPSDNLDSGVFALPAISKSFTVIASLATPGASAATSVTVYYAHSSDGPWIALTPIAIDDTTPAKAATVEVNATHVKAILSSVTVDGSTFSLSIEAK